MEKTAKNDALQFQQDAAVRILLEKKSGEMDYRCEIDANSATAAYYGISVMIKDLSEKTGMPLEHVVAVLATILLAPGQQAEGGA